MLNQNFIKKCKPFLAFPITLLFLICLIVANVWKLVQMGDRVENAAVSPVVPQVTSAVQAQTDPQGKLPGQQTQVTATDADGSSSAATDIPAATEPPGPSFQTVDKSYFDDALFVGDSRSEGLALYGDLDNADYFTNVGMSIYQVNEVSAGNPNQGEQVSFSSKLGQRQYGKVYLMLGLNELGTGTPDSWAAAYAEVVAQVRAAQPNAIIYLQSILPVSSAKDDPSGVINNANVFARNAALQALEDPSQNIFYLNVAQAVSDGNGCLNSDYTNDGIHLLGNSLHYWEEYLLSNAIVLDSTGTTDPADPPATSEPVV